MVRLNNDKKPGRNDPCSCGSGKKYKKCSLLKKVPKKDKIDLTTMLKILYCLVKGLKGSSIVITKRTIDEAMPKDWLHKMRIELGQVNGIDCYNVKVETDMDQKIVKPASNIILPGRN